MANNNDDADDNDDDNDSNQIYVNKSIKTLHLISIQDGSSCKGGSGN